ncbi:hypothetical protein Scep_007606 [Stephania cephalantha]|uniref:Uncharacterized protein n=1 Tax=Stephania cephalantha TaxID=152367 RepID=A0AAP0KC65_9MAGN
MTNEQRDASNITREHLMINNGVWLVLSRCFAVAVPEWCFERSREHTGGSCVVVF